MTDAMGVKDAANPTAAHQLLTLVFGAAMGQVVAVAGELNIADFLVDGPKTVEELSQATETNPRALKSILRALVSIGVFEQTETGSLDLHRKSGEIPSLLSGHTFVLHRTDTAQI
jgi:hypothetical protein